MHELNSLEWAYHDLKTRYFIVVVPRNDIHSVDRNAVDHCPQFQHAGIGGGPLTHIHKAWVVEDSLPVGDCKRLHALYSRCRGPALKYTARTIGLRTPERNVISTTF